MSGANDQSMPMIMNASHNIAPPRQMIQVARTIHGVRYFSNFQSNKSSQLVAG